MTAGPGKQLRRSMHRHLAAGVTAVAVLAGGIGGWAATTELYSAVVASGILVVEGNAKKVQHPAGGIVAELLVAEGQHVQAGQVLIRLDDTVTRSNLAVIIANLDQLYARQARLEAERDGLASAQAPSKLSDRVGSVEAESAMTHERRLFEDRRAAREGQKKQLQEQIVQLREQIAGLDQQRQGKTGETALIEKELDGVRGLFAKSLATLPRMNSLDRDAVRLRGESGQLTASIAAARGKIAEIELQYLQVEQTMHAEVAKELRDTANSIAELAEKKVAAQDTLRRIEIKAPVAGAVHQLAMHTVGGVIGGGDELMQIIPLGGDLIVEAQIAPQDIDQVRAGQTATLRLSAFNRTTTPELFATVTRVSADLETDKRTGAGFYRAGISIPRGELARIPDLTLVPGMPVEAFIQTGSRTALSYLIKPVSDHAQRVFRER